MCFTSDWSFIDELGVMTVAMDMKVYFVIISIMDSYIFCVWEVPMYQFLRSWKYE